MADISDCTALLASMCTAAIWPNGVGSPSVAGYGVITPPTVSAKGVGYAVGDYLYIGTGIALQVTAVTATGAVLSVVLVDSGISLSNANPVGVTSTSGSGSGATFIMPWSMCDVAVFEGWPQPNSLDATLAAGNAMVSVFPLPGMSTPVFQVQNHAYVITPAVHGLTATVVAVPGGATATLNGTPGAGEYATAIVNTQYAFSATGASANAILTSIAAQAANAFPTVSVNGNSITFPTTRLTVNIGAPAIEGWATHRQRDPIMVSVWAPNNTVRNALSKAVRVALDATNHLVFPDTSQGVLVPLSSEQTDTKQTVNIYRRDMRYTVEYATIQEFPAYEVTSFNLTISDPYGDEVMPVIG